MPGRILIVGDANADALERCLAQDFHRLRRVPAPDPRDGERCDAAVFAGGDAETVTRTIRAIRAWPEEPDTPIVCEAPADAPGLAEAAYAAGADAVVPAGLPGSLLRAVVRAQLRRAAQADLLRIETAALTEIGESASPPDPAAATQPSFTVIGERELGPQLQAAGLAVRAWSDTVVYASEIGVPIGDAAFIDMKPADRAFELAARLRNLDRKERRPLLVVVDGEELPLALKAIDLDLAEPVFRPWRAAEVAARLLRLAARHRAYRRLRDDYARRLDLAVTDSLTGLFNRRYLDAYLDMQERRTRQNDGDLALLLLDVDGFKGINDRYGHAAGDEVLRQMAARLLASIRATDTGARLGGDEFVVLMPGADSWMATTVAERLRGVIAEKAFPTLAAGGEAIAVTASVGVAVSQPGEDTADLLARADQALYAAKRSGRNRVNTAGPIAVRGLKPVFANPG